MADDVREADLRLEEARRDVELRLGELRSAIQEELGFVPRRRYWLVALVAGAGGLAFALRRKRRRRLRSKAGKRLRDEL